MATMNNIDPETGCWKWEVDTAVMQHDLDNIDKEHERMEAKYDQALQEQAEQIAEQAQRIAELERLLQQQESPNFQINLPKQAGHTPK